MMPILYTLKSVDATKDFLLRFVWEGNQSFGNTCIIKDSTSHEIVYKHTVTTMRLEHTVEKNSLKNGKWYNAIIASIDVDGNVSEYSNPIVFCCLSTPVLIFTNVTNNSVLKNASYRVTMNYSQAENEKMQSYEISLYDKSQTLIQTSGVVYTSNTNFDYMLSNLEDDTVYYLRASCYTVNGMSAYTEYIPISVNYRQPDYYSILTLENIKDDGCIKLQSNIRAVDCYINGTPVYVDNDYINLHNNIITINKDYSLDSDFVIEINGYNFIKGLIMEIQNSKVYYIKEGSYSYIELLSPLSKGYYSCQSNRLKNLGLSEEIKIIITKKDGLYDIQINRK